MERGVSVTAVGNDTAYVAGGIFIEQESEDQGAIYPTRIYTSSDGLQWDTLPDASAIMWKMPYHLFEAHGCLYFECASEDLKEFMAGFGITLEPGTLIPLFLVDILLDSGNLAPVVYRSCDGGASWTIVQDVPWHDGDTFSMPQYHVSFNNNHYTRAVTDINSPIGSRAYLFYADAFGIWQYQNVIPWASHQHVFGIGVSQNALYSIAMDTAWMSHFNHDGLYEGPTVWKSVNGVDWSPHSMQAPIAAALAASDNILVASHLTFDYVQLRTPGIYYSVDGASWFCWRDWPDDCADENCSAIPLMITDDALYLSVEIVDDWSTVTELWRMPVSLFLSDGPPRVTISRAMYQPAHATAFPIYFDIVWSKPVYGFSANDIVLDGFYFTLDEASQKNDGTHYILTVTGIVYGEGGTIVAPTIPEGMVVDGQGNPNEEAACVNADVVLELSPQVSVYKHSSGAILLVLLALLGVVRTKRPDLLRRE